MCVRLAGPRCAVVSPLLFHFSLPHFVDVFIRQDMWLQSALQRPSAVLPAAWACFRFPGLPAPSGIAGSRVNAVLSFCGFPCKFQRQLHRCTFSQGIPKSSALSAPAPRLTSCLCLPLVPPCGFSDQSPATPGISLWHIGNSCVFWEGWEVHSRPLPDFYFFF